MTSIESFVLLKYEIITGDSTTWKFCETYPEKVLYNTILRIIDVDLYLHPDHKYYQTSRNNFDLIENYINGKISKHEVIHNWITEISRKVHINLLYYIFVKGAFIERAKDFTTIETITKILIEELCNYENNQYG